MKRRLDASESLSREEFQLLCSYVSNAGWHISHRLLRDRKDDCKKSLTSALIWCTLAMSNIFDKG
jgi:hypothetical protein